MSIKPRCEEELSQEISRFLLCARKPIAELPFGDCLLQRFYGCCGLKEHPVVRFLCPQKDITSTRAVKLCGVGLLLANASIFTGWKAFGLSPRNVPELHDIRNLVEACHTWELQGQGCVWRRRKGQLKAMQKRELGCFREALGRSQMGSRILCSPWASTALLHQSNTVANMLQSAST